MDGEDLSLSPYYQLNKSFAISFSRNSTETNNGTIEDYIPHGLRPETYIVPALFVVIFAVGLLGNGTLVLIFARNRRMRSVPNMYILSLALGDFFVIVGTVPFISTVYTFESWPYGTFVCKLSELLKDASSGVTIFTLTLLSVDRYIAIARPLQRLTVRNGKTLTLVLAGLVWVVAIAVAIPGAHFAFLWEVPLYPGHVIQVCYPFPEHMSPWYPRTMVLVKFSLLYLVPLTLIAAFYALMARYLVAASKDWSGNNDSHNRRRRERTKVAKIILVFVVLFAVCFFPSHVFMLWFYFHPNALEQYSEFWHAWKIVGYVLTFSNSCLNPVALYFVSGAFRLQYRKYLFCCGRKKTRENYLSSFKTFPNSSCRSILRRTVVSKM